MKETHHPSGAMSEAEQAMLRCPVCRSDMVHADRCELCGERYGTESGTPRLISSRAQTEVTYQFSTQDSVVPADFYAALGYPPRTTGDRPYHLDPAHQLVIEQTSGTVLEIGCGGGQMRRWVRSRGLEYVGIDISKSRIDSELQAHGGPDYLADAHFLPFRDGSFDLVYSAAVTEHIADPHLMMSEVWRVLKPGGVYLGNCSFLEPWHDDSFFHMSPLGAYRALRRSGFNVRNVWPGVGYSGYFAILKMGTRLTQPLAPLGIAFAFLHRFALKLRRFMRHPEPIGGAIAWEGRVAGAVDWIATKPGSTSPAPAS